jgi:hypothetical protein
MEQKKRVTEATPTIDDAKVGNFSEIGKDSGEKNDGIAPERLAELAKAIMDEEVMNIPDESEQPSLYNINGVEVISPCAITLVTAQKKSGKSNFKGVLIAAGLHAESQVLNGAVRSNLGRLGFLDIDTEQPKKDARRLLRRIMKTAGYEYNSNWAKYGLHCISVKDYAAEDSRIMVELAIVAHKPQIVFIDGIADIITSINNEQESVELFKWLDYLSCQYECAIVGMLHQNFGTSKIGGWAGTQGGKKYSDGFSLTKSKGSGFFTVAHEGRSESAPDLRFRIECPPGDKIGWYAPVDDTISELSEEDQEKAMYQELVDAAPLPMRNKQFVIWLMNTKRWTSDSPAKKALRKMKEYGIVDSKREGKSSIWFKPSGIQDATEEPLPLEED